jgi:YVTN family beta-propeller protein
MSIPSALRSLLAPLIVFGAAAPVAAAALATPPASASQPAAMRATRVTPARPATSGGASQKHGARAATTFTCSTATIFLSQHSPTGLYGGVLAAGKINFSEIGKTSTWIYNAIGFDTKSNYIYGISLPGSKNPAGHLLEIGSTGAVTDLGSVAGDATLDKDGSYSGSFDGSGNFWVTTPTAADEIDVTSKPAKVLKSVKFAPSKPGWLATDFTYADGYMWGLASSSGKVVVERLNLASGDLSTYSAPNVIPTSQYYGAAWTFGNGDLGFQSNTTGQIFELAVTDPTTTPTFSLVSLYSGPVSPGNNDGTICAPKPVDLAITESAATSVAPAGKVTWTIQVTNNGPGNSSGYVVEDNVPAGVTDVASTSLGCKATGNAVRCSEGALPDHTGYVLSVSGDAPNLANTSFTNTVTVIGNEQNLDPSKATDSFTTKTGLSTPGLTPGTPASGQVLTSFSESATISNGTKPTGELTFGVYGPFSSSGTASCTGTEGHIEQVNVVNGNDSYQAPAVTITTAGKYVWGISYKGDSNNHPVATTCSSAFLVNKASPTIAAQPEEGAQGTSFTESADLSGGTSSPGPTGSIIFYLVTKCPSAGTAPSGPSETATGIDGDGTYTSPAFSGIDQGTYYLVAVYGGDADNNSATSSSCGSGTEVDVSGPPPPLNNGYVADTAALENFEPSGKNPGTTKVSGTPNSGDYDYYYYGDERTQIVALSPNGAFLYEADYSSDAVYVIATSDDALVDTITGFYSGPTALAMAPNGLDVWVATTDGVAEVSTQSNTIVAFIPVGEAIAIAVSPNSEVVYVAGNVAAGYYGVTEIDAATDAIITDANIYSACPDSAPLSLLIASGGTTGEEGFVTCEVTGTTGAAVGINLDPTPSTSVEAIIGTAPTGETPLDPVLNGTTLYVANYSTGTVTVINTQELGVSGGNPVTATLNTGGTPDALAVDEGVLYVADSTDGTVLPYSTSNNSELASGKIIVGSDPDWIATDGDNVYVANYSSGTISILVSPTATPLTIDLQGDPFDITFANPPPATTTVLSAGNITSPNTSGSLDLSVNGTATVTYTATVTAVAQGGGTVNDGTVSFADTTGVLDGYANNSTSPGSCGAVAVSSSGVATCTVTYSSAGNDVVAATYSGDTSTFNGSTSSTITENISWTSSGPPADTAFIANTDNGELFQTSNDYGEGAISTTNSSSYYCYDYTSEGRPQIAVSTPDGSYIYEVNSSSPGEVFVVSTSSGALVTPQPISGLYGYPTSIAISPNGQYVWVGTTDGVDEISTASNTVIAIIPTGGETCAIQVSPSGKYVYALGSATSVSDAVTEINAATGTIYTTVSFDGVGCSYTPNAFVVTSVADDTSVFKAGLVAGFATCNVSSAANGYLIALALDNTTTGTPGAKEVGATTTSAGNEVGVDPLSPVVAPSSPGGVVNGSATVFVANNGSGTLSAVEISQLASTTPAVTTIPDGTGSEPDALALDEVTTSTGSTPTSQEILYAANYDSTSYNYSSTVVPYAISGNSAAELASGPILVGSEPNWLAVDGTSLYVSDYGGTPTSSSGSGAVSVIDTTSEAVTDTINLTSQPLNIVFSNPQQETTNTLTASNINSNSGATSGGLSLSPGSPATVTYTATIAGADSGSNIGATTGSVAFADATGVLNGFANGSSALGSCGAVAAVSGVATCTVSYSSAGQDVITATYDGDSSEYDGSTSSSLTESISWSSGNPPEDTAYVASSDNGELLQTATNIASSPINATNSSSYYCYDYYNAGRPQIAATTPDGAYVYEVNSSDPGEVFVVSTSSDLLVTPQPITGLYGYATSVAVSPNGADVWVGTTDGVDEISTASNTVVAIIPTGGAACGIQVGPGGQVVYAVGSSTGYSESLVEIDAATDTIYTSVNLSSVGCDYDPDQLTITPISGDLATFKQGEAGFTTCSDSSSPGYLMALTLDTSTSGSPEAGLVGTNGITVGIDPVSPAVAPSSPGGSVTSSSTVFVANYDSGTLSAVELSQFGEPSPFVSTIPDGTGTDPDGLAVDEVSVSGSTPEEMLYAANYDETSSNYSSTVMPYEVSGNSANELASGPILVGSEPDWLAVDGSSLYVGDYGGTPTSSSGAVSVIDTTSDAVTATITLTSTPLNIIFTNPQQPTAVALTASNISSGNTSGSLSLAAGTPPTGGTVTYTATVTSAGSDIGTTTGTAAFADATGVLNGYADGSTTPGSCGTAAVTSGVATCTVTYTSAGADTVTATYSGDTTNYDGSTSLSLTENTAWTSGGPPADTAYVASTDNGQLFQAATGLGQGSPNDTANGGYYYYCNDESGYYRPQVAAMTPNGSYVYEVNGSSPGEVFVVSTSSGDVISTIGALGGYPTSVAVAPNGQDVWVGTTSGVDEISTASNTLVAVIPVSDICGVAVSPNSSVVYAIGSAQSVTWGLTEINASTDAIFYTVNLSGLQCSYAPYSLTVSAVGSINSTTNPTGEMGFSSCSESAGNGRLIGMALDPSPPTSGNSAEAELFGSGVPVGASPVDPVVAPETPGGTINTSGTVFVANEGSGTISAVEIGDLGGSSVATIPDGSGSQPDALAVDEVTNTSGGDTTNEEILYAANYDSTQYTIPSTVVPYLISGASNTASELPSGPILVGSEPDWLAVDGSSLYVSDYGGTPESSSDAGSLTVIDTTTGAVTDTITLTSTPLNIVFSNPGPATKTVLTSTATSVNTGQAVTYTATVTLGNGTTAVDDASSYVSFADATGVLTGVVNGGGTAQSCGAVPINSSGVATCKVTYNSAGSDAITATFSGDTTTADTYDGSTSNAVGPVTISWPGGTGPTPPNGYVSVSNDMNSFSAVTNKSTENYSNTSISAPVNDSESVVTADGYVFEIDDDYYQDLNGEYGYWVYAIDISTDTVTDLFMAGNQPQALVEAPNGEDLYVATNTGVTEIATPEAPTAPTVQQSLSIGSYSTVAVNPTSTVLYLAGNTNSVGYAVTEVNITTPADLVVINSTATQGEGCDGNAYDLVVNSTHTDAYVTCSGTTSGTGAVVAVTIDASVPSGASALNAFGGVTVGYLPYSEELGDNGTYLFVASYGGSTSTGYVYVINPAAISGESSSPIVQTVSDGGGSEPSAVAVIGSMVYVANQGYNTVTPYTITASTTAPLVAATSGPIYLVGTTPTGLYVDGNAQSVYVVNANGNPSDTSNGIIDVIDTSSGAIVQTIPMAGTPYSIAFGS